jgi:hypothetical protein
VGLSTNNTAHDDVPSFADLYGGTVGVSTKDPGRAFARGSSRFEIRWPEATVFAESSTELGSDRDEYRLHIELRVGEEGNEPWTRTWNRTFPRDHQ